MEINRRLILIAVIFIVLFGFLATAAPLFAASKEKVLHSFNDNGTDGATPQGNLIFDAAGNLYGTTDGGGAYNEGTVFELTPGANGTWTEIVLHSFGNGTDGQGPLGGLVFDSDGNLYGTTFSGGAYVLGTVFELMTGSDGTWTESLLYSFGDGADDGRNPVGGLVIDASGNLYGVTEYGGTGRPNASGTVFELMPGANGTWTESVLYDFCTVSECTDGGYPGSGLIFDSAGENLYGSTGLGGVWDRGTIFKLAPTNGNWTEEVLHSFHHNRIEGYYPLAGVIFDAAGNLYGTTTVGGRYDSNCKHGIYPLGCGTVFQLTPETNGTWSEKVLHSFRGSGKGNDGGDPTDSLTLDASGNLYGTTHNGAAYDGGTVFQLSRGTNGKWTERVLHTFGKSHDGSGLSDSLIFDAAGNLYGTTYGGGIYGVGIVFEITP